MEQTLVAEAKDAPREADLAFDRLYRSSRDDVYAYVAGLLRDATAAEEVTAAAFERAYRKRNRFNPRRGEPRAWLFGIARNAALDELRRRGRQAEMTTEPADLGSLAGYESAEHSERRLAVSVALERLQPGERELIALKFFAGLANAEIAQVLGTSESNAGTKLHRAMTKLREACDGTARNDRLIADLQALRPTPRPQFSAALDERAAAGFPRRSRLPRLTLSLPSLPSLRLLIPAGGLTAILLAVVIALSAGGGSESSQGGEHFSESPSSPPHAAINQAAPNASQGAAAAQESSGTLYGAEAEVLPSEESVRPFNRNVHPSIHRRAVERSAEITLAASPKDVNADATRVFEAVHANNGIVMRSSTQEGRPGEARATFDLLIPSARLDDAMAAFSDIDAVRSRHEATADITAPTVTAAELLKESRARIDSLLGQLEGAETEEEQEAIEAELRHERRHAGRLAAQLSHLHKRADFSRVSLRIETGGKESSRGGAWGIDDALHDAGHVLTVAAAVALIALAVLGPIALIALLGWLTHRAWVRRERRRVLS